MGFSLAVTVNTDDPPMFGTDLTGEYLHIAQLAGLDPAGVAGLAANGIRSSFLAEPAKQWVLAPRH